MNNFSTLNQLIAFQAAKFNNPLAFNFKENDKWISFSNQEFLQKAFHFACGLREIGFAQGDALAIFSYQNPIWLIADFGAILAGGISVPIFHNISQDNLNYQLEDSGAKYIFTDSHEISNLLENKNAKIISYNFENAASISFKSLVALGCKAVAEKKYDLNSFLKNKSEHNLATIIYTSGSTGRPKGVELTHANLVSQIKGTAQFFPLDSNSDKALSFLPLAHIFERMVMMFYIMQGIEIYFVNDIKNLGGFLREVRPTLMTSVPRMLEKVFAKIKDGIDNGGFFKKFIGQKALQSALIKHPSDNKNLCDKIFDRLVYKKFREALGCNMRMIICGGAALSQDMERFYKNIGVNLYCGYGLTESSPVLTANCPAAYKFSTIGKAFPSVQLKIADDGELLARGPNIMQGYHNKPEKTRETIIDGWLLTGDLAQIDADGFVKIIGRKKELFKTANAKYVRPVPIEQKLVQELQFLMGAIIIAEGRKFTSALLFPDFELLKKFKAKFNFLGDDLNFLKSAALQNAAQSIISKVNENLDHAEQIQKFAIISAEISIESGEITPSMKLKRNVLEEKFKDVIEGFYNN